MDIEASLKNFRWGLVVLAAALLVGLTWFAHGKFKTVKVASSQPTPVSAATVGVADVTISIGALGAAQAWQAVVIRAQVSGRLKRVAVREGAEVKEGELIAELDSAPYRALLLQAQGALERDKAQLEIARLDLERYQRLLALDSIARSQVDTQKALVTQREGTVLIDQGSVDSAQVNLNYCRIASPVTGRVGVRLVDAGNLVSATDAGGILTITQMVPMAVTFSVAEGDFRKLADASAAFSRPLTAVAYSQDTGILLGSGQLNVTDNHVDAASGTVQMKARFENTDKKLWPGQFVNVRIALNTLSNAVIVPSAAINRGPNGAFVYVVGTDRKVIARPIAVTTIQNGNAVITKGLEVGETVVTDGQISLKPGLAVVIHNPTAAVAATP
jgi:membrane fusion protein, multidrug efflux system